MYKKGDILHIGTPETLSGFENLMFTEDAENVHGNPLKYIGGARPVCEEYLRQEDRDSRKVVCQSCRHQCPKKKYMVKYVGAFSEEAAETVSSKKKAYAAGRTVNIELDELLRRQKAAVSAKQPGKPAADSHLKREQALLAHQAAVKITSPFLMQTIASGRAVCEDVPVDYVVLEYAEGMELGNYIAVLQNMWDQEEADRRRLDLIRQLLYTVRAYAKQYSAVYNVHRDLKPDNIMIYTYGEDNEYQQLKLLDFEMLVEQGNIQTDDLYMGGTRGYVHPEAFRMANLPDEPDRQFSHRWDLYAVGLIMYEIMEGHPHFENDDYLEDVQLAYTVKSMKCSRDYPALKKMIQWLIADQDSHYNDIDEVIDDYQEFLERLNKNWYADYYMDHWLECKPGYEQNLRFFNVYCKISSKGLKDCRQSFCVTENTVTTLVYGGNIIGYKNVMGSLSAKERGVQKVIGSFYYIEDKIRFMPLTEECLLKAADVDNRDRAADVIAGDVIEYLDVTIEIERIDCYK